MKLYKYYYSYFKLEGRKNCDKIIKDNSISTDSKEQFIKNMTAFEDKRLFKITRTKQLN